MAIIEFIAYRGEARGRCAEGRELRCSFSRNPIQTTIREFLAAQKQQKFSYAHVGASRTEPPSGYILDHNRMRLGEGRIVFERAKNAIKQWKMFDMAWLELFWPDTAIEPGSTVALVVSHLGFWSLNAARIVYTVEEERGVLEDTDSPTVRCPTTRKWAKSASPSNFIPAMKASGTTYTLSPARAPLPYGVPLYPGLAEKIRIRFEICDAKSGSRRIGSERLIFWIPAARPPESEFRQKPVPHAWPCKKVQFTNYFGD